MLDKQDAEILCHFSRGEIVKKVLTFMTALLLGLATTAAAQVDFATGDDVVILLEDGTAVGSGFVDENGLMLNILEDIELLDDESGQATMFITSSDGVTREYEVMIEDGVADFSIATMMVLQEDGSFISAEQALDEAGFEVSVDRVEEIVAPISPGSSIGTEVEEEDVEDDVDVSIDTDEDDG
jgi:hypothetical protein